MFLWHFIHLWHVLCDYCLDRAVGCFSKTTHQNTREWNIFCRLFPNSWKSCYTIFQYPVPRFLTWIIFHVSFLWKQPAFYHLFEAHYPTPLKKYHMGLDATDNEFSTQFWLLEKLCSFPVSRLKTLRIQSVLSHLRMPMFIFSVRRTSIIFQLSIISIIYLKFKRSDIKVESSKLKIDSLMRRTNRSGSLLYLF